MNLAGTTSLIRFWLVGITTTHIISSQDCQVERHQLQGDDTEDALQTVHDLRQLNGLVGILAYI